MRQGFQCDMSDYHAAPRLGCKKSNFWHFAFIGGGLEG